MQEGNIIREIRLSKNISLKQAASTDMTASFVAKFERGESDISLSRFYDLLDNLHVSMQEYDLYRSGYAQERVEKELEEFTLAWQISSAENVKKIAQKHLKKYQTFEDVIEHHIFTIFSAIADFLDNKAVARKELQKVADYLFISDPWGINELYLLHYGIYVFDKDILITMSRIVGEAGGVYLSDFNYRHEYMIVINNLITRLFELGEYSRAKRLIASVLEKTTEDDMAVVLKLRFIDRLINSILMNEHPMLEAKKLIAIPKELGFAELSMKLDIFFRHEEDMTHIKNQK